ncbi:MAG: aminopeptidase [Gammaproteobacteria bacterium]
MTPRHRQLPRPHHPALRRGAAPARALRALALLVVALALGGCESLAFYRQAIAGQLEIWRRERDVAAVLADPAVPATTRAQLALATRAREFAAAQLALPADGGYRTYAELDRPYVVWNVFAAPALALEPVQSCFPFAGCLAYRGYFRQADAARYADALAARGHDVFVGGVPAYSTLGWFDDPLLSTFLHWDEADLVELLFHELAHQKLYVKDDSAFNESYASAVAAAGLARWLGPRTAAAARARAVRRARRAMTARILDARAALATLYASAADSADKLAGKHAILGTLGDDLATLAQASGLPVSAAPPWNNARIAAVATYHDYAPAFAALLALVDDDFARFHAAAARVGALAPAARAACLARLAGATTLPVCAR